MDDLTTLCCSRCKTGKPLSEFNRDRNRESGYYPTCKACRVIARASSGSTRPPLPIRHCNKCNEDKPFLDFHRSARRSDGFAPYCKTCIKAYHVSNIDRRRETNHEWYHANIASARNTARESAKKHRAVRRQNSRNHWARKHSADGHCSAKEWSALCDWFGNVCLACGKAESVLQSDHVIPLTKGGTNHIENLQPLCHSCNASKGNRHATDYRNTTRLAEFFRVYYPEECVD